MTDNPALPDTCQANSPISAPPEAEAESKSFRIFAVVLEGTAFRVQILGTDPGMGIPSEQLHLIFDTFREGDASTISSNFIVELSRLPSPQELADPHAGGEEAVAVVLSALAHLNDHRSTLSRAQMGFRHAQP